jgi:hypothetical protein
MLKLSPTIKDMLEEEDLITGVERKKDNAVCDEILARVTSLQ